MSSVITREIIQKEFIQEITLKKDELSRHLKNAEINLQKSITNQCHIEIINKNRENVLQMKEKIDNYESQLSQIKNNDSEMLDEIERRYTVRLEKDNKDIIDFKRKIEKKRIKKKGEKKVLDGFFKSEKKIRTDIKSQKRNTRYAYKHFCRSMDSLPGYIARNLKNMPNNKGYIWRSVCYYGHKTANENEPTFLFEKKHGTLYIHEYTHNEYFYFSKVKDGPKVLLKHENRRVVFPEFTKPVVRQKDSGNGDRRNNYRRNNDRGNNYQNNNDRRNGDRRNNYQNNNDRRNNDRRNNYQNNNDRRNDDRRNNYQNNNDRRNDDRRNNYQNNDDRGNNDRRNNDRRNNDRRNNYQNNNDNDKGNNDRRNNDRRNNYQNKNNNNDKGNNDRRSGDNIKASSWKSKGKHK